MPSSRFHSSGVLVAVSVVGLGVLGCAGAPTSPVTELTELLGARVPTTAPAGAGFMVVGYFGHGACDRVTPIVEQTPSSLRMALVRQVDRTPQPCVDILVGDSVVARVGAGATLPFTVRLARRGAGESVIVVRGP
jgi:hypothetical protein